ncbi:MAG: class I SAM-dependent methyltransferase [Planctomycetes bacterium]|nr:class I SAM-dependent methyltransferase [Planctomycetota bacterium]
MTNTKPSVPLDTRSGAYCTRLCRKSGATWKSWLGVQRPYRWMIRRVATGRILDLGCGIGRNLAHLDGRAVGVDHNPHSVLLARSRGHQAFTPEEFRNTEYAQGGLFDGLLLAHVLEHMSYEEGQALVTAYRSQLRPQGRLILIVPQSRGFRSDPTHRLFYDALRLTALARFCGFQPDRSFSFPLPWWAGGLFTHNETYLVATRSV